MNTWLNALKHLHSSGNDAVLVTVSNTQGSAPREVGARMVFTATQQFDTIGGGHLEWRAAQIARSMLSPGIQEVLSQDHRIALGPSLGQCCGGVVFLRFDNIRSFDADQLAEIEKNQAPLPQVVLFGAGHVGAAIVRVLATLPCRILWVDEREDMFPADLPEQVTIEATDVPNAVVDQVEAGTYFLVMTHSHSLDQQLSERILKRADIAWFGLIGSQTKRKQFEHRLLDRGITPTQLQKMTCPIGIAGIRGKEPASIAIAVTAQLLQLWESKNSIEMHIPKQRSAGKRTGLETQ